MWNPTTINLIVKLLPLIMQAVVVVEKLVTTKKGKEKQDAAVEVVKIGMQATEVIANKDVFTPEVEGAVRIGIDAVVAGLNRLSCPS